MLKPEEILKHVKHTYVKYSEEKKVYLPVSHCIKYGKKVRDPRSVGVVIPLSELERLVEKHIKNVGDKK